MEDIVYDPLASYRDKYCGAFRKNAEDAFQEIAQKAGIDKDANKKLCLEIADLESSLEDLRKRRSRLNFIRVLLWILAIALFCILPLDVCDQAIGILSLVIAVFIVLYIFISLNKKIKKANDEIDNLDSSVRQKKEEAWEQMAPLNSLFSWDIPARLIEKTIPILHFDPYFTKERMAELEDDFGYDNSLNEDASVIYSQSGSINGNPFVIAEVKTTYIGTETYTGQKTIHWTTTTRGADGKYHRVSRSQTLTATVEKPCPRYGKEKFVLYGNEAAPNLKFLRIPAGLSEDGFFQKFRRRQKLKELQKFSRNLEDDSDYTLMANHDFEVLFETKNRNNEVEYRLLFTALAQRQMLDLIKDSTYAFGDDFQFLKQQKINLIIPEHLKELRLDTNPDQFADYDFERTRSNFVSINQEYFRAVYFAMAPLLAIPLYQQMRTRKTIYGDDCPKSSYWEWEAIANSHGEDAFKHEDCITDCILKTTLQDEYGKAETINVTAHGYAGERCVDYVSVLGGDGKRHKVPVEWILYTPISKTSTMLIEEHPELTAGIMTEDNFYKKGMMLRRGIYSKTPRGFKYSSTFR